MKDLRKKRLIQEYIYTKTELEYRKFLIEENTNKFLNSAYSKAGKEREVSEETNKENNKVREERLKPDWSEFDPLIREKAKKLYREISKRTHPDKDPEGIYSETFKDAAQAYEECNIFDLYELGEKLEIDYLIDELEVDLIKSKIETNKSETENLEKTFIYIWSVQSDESMREIILRQFVRSMGDKM